MTFIFYLLNDRIKENKVLNLLKIIYRKSGEFMSAEREITESGGNSVLLKNRRFVGVKETVAYVLEDTAQSLNINDFKDRYIYDVVKIDFSYLAIQNIVATVWDTFNDTFIGVIVEKTRTRWGKFRPYLLLGQLPLTLLGLWY